MNFTRLPGSSTLPFTRMSWNLSIGFCSITGGVVYRGTAIPDLAGAYLFGDYCQPGLFSLRLDGDEVGEDRVLDAEVSAVVSIDADADGEVYVLSLDGTIFRLTAA